MYDFREWKHVFKLDPDKEISDEALEAICESGTDAIMVGGSDGITLEKVLDLMARVRRYTVPCVLEISDAETVTPGFDLYFIPSVLNSTDPDWIMNLHHKAVKEYGEIMNWDEIFVEGYCILNPYSKAALLTKADANKDAEDVGAYAMMAERMFHLPIFYLEYSGMYGDPLVAEKAKSNLEEAVFFYGGGIASAEQAKEMAAHADVIVVGNIIYDNLEAALETVKAVK
ncbi:heptaprenylglyceryl phosphate synthase [Bacillus sp. MUM 13]|uniref:heptaprenylglyceryl phosphate synthase n=1 Tax=Bacillus sp. MUM 13 TaxID=1678001 RepID=UPI0008F55E87|nr:heptaprenylglyceryl phosphate synthase [Bacillus sp. MUM 13]OIK08938.1 geranylgeranylglyceryl/heptaprenylglyceryl phosphate synthase [Bacillus sp. MUM 13]